MRHFVRGMNTQISLGYVEDQPALAHVIVDKAELISDKRTNLFGIRRVDQAVHSLDHLPTHQDGSMFVTLNV